VLVWDDELEITDDDLSDHPLPMARPAPTPLSPEERSATRPRSEQRVRSRSIGSFPFPPPMRRSTTESAVGPGTRPVPFANKFQKINPGASGVTVLEHMERLDEVERGLKKLGMEEAVVEEEELEEDDVGMTTTDRNGAQEVNSGDLIDHDLGDAESDQQLEALASSTISAPLLSGYESNNETEVGDSQPYEAQQETQGRRSHDRAASDQGGRRSLDWLRLRHGAESSMKKRTVIVEVCLLSHGY
jgi:phosphatidylinositol 4-kinase type 2